MKNMIKTIIGCCALTVALALPASAQVTYFWDDFSIQITVPNDFKATKDTGTELEMKGDGMEMLMYIFADKKITSDDIDEATKILAKDMKLGEIDEQQAFKNGDFEGYYVEGFKDGKRVMLAGVVDLTSSTNFFIVLTFGDTDKEAEKEALVILNSLDHK